MSMPGIDRSGELIPVRSGRYPDCPPVAFVTEDADCIGIEDGYPSDR
jgi:hypothetical protein